MVRHDERYGNKRDRTSGLIAKIHNFLDEDTHVSLKTINLQLEISVSPVHRIIPEDLNKRKICPMFLSRAHTDEQN